MNGWILRAFFSNKFGTNSSKNCVLKVHLEYLEELLKLHNDCPLAQGEIETIKEILSKF